MSTIINITKEVIESQHLGDGFSICVEKNGRITIEPTRLSENAEVIGNGINQNNISDTDPVLKDWNDATPHLVAKENDDWTW